MILFNSLNDLFIFATLGLISICLFCLGFYEFYKLENPRPFFDLWGKLKAKEYKSFIWLLGADLLWLALVIFAFYILRELVFLVFCLWGLISFIKRITITIIKKS